MSGFVLDLATLSRGASQVAVGCGAADLGLASPEWPGEVRGELAVELNGEQVSVRGRILALARLECARCLTRYDLPLEVPFEVFAERAGSGRSRDEEQALESDRYMMFHDGRLLDLRDEARETLQIELPMIPRCREECMGLCSRCGADLNQGPCACAP
jgi:uncharacterized protein